MYVTDRCDLRNKTFAKVSLYCCLFHSKRHLTSCYSILLVSYYATKWSTLVYKSDGFACALLSYIQYIMCILFDRICGPSHSEKFCKCPSLINVNGGHQLS